MVALMPANASGALRAMLWARADVAASSSAAATTWWTMPISSARGASIGWPVNMRWRVWAGPMISTSFCPRTKGTTRPIRASGIPKRATSDATRRSQWSASSQPPAMASPWTMAMVGCFDRSTRPSTSMTLPSGSPWAPRRSSISLRSMPEQKAGPAPRTTTTRTSRLASSSSKRWRSEASSALFMALRWPGRLRVTVAMPPSMAQRTSSDMPVLLLARGRRETAHGIEHERAPALRVRVVGLELQEGRVDPVVEIALDARADGGKGAARDQLVDDGRGNGRDGALAVPGAPGVPHRLERGRPPEPLLVGAIDGHVQVRGDVAPDDLVRLGAGRVQVDEETGSDLDGVGVAAGARSGLADDRHALRDVLGRVPVDDDAVADFTGHLEHAGTQRRDVDGHGRVGHLRQAEAVHRDRLTLEDDTLAGERRAEKLRRLAHPRGGLGEHAAVPRLHDRLRALADAEDEAPRGEVREPGGRGGERRGAARVDVGDGDAEPHARGGGA